MVFVGVSNFEKMNLIFVDPWIKISGTYCSDVLLSKQLLPVMHEISSEFFIFQQDNALRCLAANLLQSPTAQEFWKSVNICQSYAFD